MIKFIKENIIIVILIPHDLIDIEPIKFQNIIKLKSIGSFILVSKKYLK